MKVEYNKEVAIQILDRQISCLQSKIDKAKHDLMCIDLIVINLGFSECNELSSLNYNHAWKTKSAYFFPVRVAKKYKSREMSLEELRKELVFKKRACKQLMSSLGAIKSRALHK